MTRPCYLHVRHWLWRIGLLSALCASSVSAQDDTVLVSLVAEAAYSEQDHRAILWTMGRRAKMRGVTLAQQMRSYCSVWKRERIPERVVDALSNPGAVRSILRTIDRYRSGRLPDPCRGRSVHFGARYGVDLENAKGWREIDCGDTSNAYYSVR